MEPIPSRIAKTLLAGLVALAILPFAGATHTTEGLPGEGCAVTKGGWGAEPRGHNPGALLHHWFDDVFGESLVVGDLVFEDAQDVTDFLPDGGTQLEEQAVALAINIAFGDAGLLGGTVSTVIVSSDNETIDGLAAWEVLELAEDVMRGSDDHADHEDLKDAMDALNNELFGCAEPCPEMDMTAMAQANGSIVLEWTDVDADEYNLYRAADDGDFAFLATTSGTTYTDTTTAPGVVYTYVVTIVVDDRESDACAGAQATAIPFFTAPVLGALALCGSLGAYAWMRRR